MASATGGGEGKAGRAKCSLSLLSQIVVNCTCENVHVLTDSCAAHIVQHSHAELCAAKLGLCLRQPAPTAAGYGHSALFSLKETKSTSNAEQPQAAPVV